MKKLVVSTALVAVLFGTAFAEYGRTALTFENVAAAADCDNKASPFRPWCIVKDWPKGKADAPTKTLLGLAVEVPTYRMGTGPYKEVLETKGKIELVAFAVDGSKITLHRLKPAKGEEAMFADAVAKVSAVFNAKSKSAAVKKELAARIAKLGALTTATKKATELSWSGERFGELRKVGTLWVAVEGDVDFPAGGDPVRIVILTDAWQ
jgi:hypothetical protein